MDITEAQQKVLKLMRLAASAGESEEGRTAAAAACRLVIEHGLLIMKPGDLTQMIDDAVARALATAAAASSASESPSGKRLRRKRPNAKVVRETMTTVAETATTALDAASRVANAVNGFRNAIRGGGT